MDPFAERMELLRARFCERTEAEREELGDAITAGDDSTAIRILHSLAGNAGMFGYPALSKAARDLERALESGARAEERPQLLQQVMEAFPGRDRAIPGGPDQDGEDEVMRTGLPGPRDRGVG